MTENLSGVVCTLGGAAFQVGGQCLLGYGILYSVRGISSGLTDILERMPRYFNNPTKVMEDAVKVSTDGQQNQQTWNEWLQSTGIRGGLVLGVIATGVVVKHIGRYVSDPSTIAYLTEMTGGN